MIWTKVLVFFMLLFCIPTTFLAINDIENNNLRDFQQLLEKLSSSTSKKWKYFKELDSINWKSGRLSFKGQIREEDSNDYHYYFRKYEDHINKKSVMIYEYYKDQIKKGSFYYEQKKLKIAIWYNINKKISQGNIYINNKLSETLYYNDYGVPIRKVTYIYNRLGQVIQHQSDTDFTPENQILGEPEY